MTGTACRMPASMLRGPGADNLSCQIQHFCERCLDGVGQFEPVIDRLGLDADYGHLRPDGSAKHAERCRDRQLVKRGMGIAFFNIIDRDQINAARSAPGHHGIDEKDLIGPLEEVECVEDGAPHLQGLYFVYRIFTQFPDRVHTNAVIPEEDVADAGDKNPLPGRLPCAKIGVSPPSSFRFCPFSLQLPTVKTFLPSSGLITCTAHERQGSKE